MHDTQEFAPRTRPQILLGAMDCDGAGSDERDAHVLIARQFGFTTVVAFEVCIEPVDFGS
jgi:hypothetical protein